MAAPCEASLLIETLSQLDKQKLKDDPKTKALALNISRRLVSELNGPVNNAVELAFSPFLPATARMAVDLKLFELIANHSRPISTAELSERSGGEALLVKRLLRVLASIGFVAETGNDMWMALPITRVMASPPITAGHRFMWDILVAAAIKGPEYLRQNSFVCPTSPTDGFVQLAHQTPYKMFEYMAKEKPDILQDFNLFMGHAHGSRTPWVEWFPVQEKLLQGYEPETALIVDVGGGKGHDLQAFKRKFPNINGRLVLQDLPQALDGIQPGSLDVVIEKQVQDFFTPNQVVGARTYFIHLCLHDWSDEYCLTILKHIREAMKPGYSKLLIGELILPEQHVSTFQAIYDMTMLTVGGGMERSRAQWTELLAQAGLSIVDFWFSNEGDDTAGIVEAIVKQ